MRCCSQEKIKWCRSYFWKNWQFYTTTISHFEQLKFMFQTKQKKNWRDKHLRIVINFLLFHAQNPRQNTHKNWNEMLLREQIKWINVNIGGSEAHLEWTTMERKQAENPVLVWFEHYYDDMKTRNDRNFTICYFKSIRKKKKFQ